MTDISQVKPYCFIYCLTNKVTGKMYVGQTIRTVAKRFQAHCDRSGICCSGIHGAIAKYGRDQFLVEEIDLAVNQEDLDAKETLWIQRLGTVSPAGYNLTEHGRGPGSPSDETRERQRQAKLAVAQTEEFKQAMRVAGRGNKGKKKSPEHAANAAAAVALSIVTNGGGFTKGMKYKTRSDKGSKRSPGTGDNIRAGRAAAKARREAEDLGLLTGTP